MSAVRIKERKRYGVVASPLKTYEAWERGREGRKKQQVARKGGRLNSFPVFQALEKVRLRWWHSSPSREGYLSFQVLPKVYFFCERFGVAFVLAELTQELEHGQGYQCQWGRECLLEISSTVNL